MPSGRWKIKVDGKYLDREECYSFNQNFNIYKRIKEYTYLTTQDYIFESHDEKNKVVTIKESFETTFYEFINDQWIEEKSYFVRLETSIDYLINYDKAKEYFEKIRKKE